MKHPSDNCPTGPVKSFEEIGNLFGKESVEGADKDFDNHVNKSLSLVLHYDDVREMVEIIRKIRKERTNKRS